VKTRSLAGSSHPMTTVSMCLILRVHSQGVSESSGLLPSPWLMAPSLISLPSDAVLGHDTTTFWIAISYFMHSTLYNVNRPNSSYLGSSSSGSSASGTCGCCSLSTTFSPSSPALSGSSPAAPVVTLFAHHRSGHWWSAWASPL